MDSRRKPDWRFPGRKAPSVLMPLFWPAQWVAHISALGINNLHVHSETQPKSQQLLRRQVDKSTKMGRNQHKKEKNIKNQNTSPPTKDQNSSPAREQSWTENDCDEMTESDFRRWVMRNFYELKEHVLNQCKETKNLEKRFEEMITRMDNLERNMNELKELKKTT